MTPRTLVFILGLAALSCGVAAEAVSAQQGIERVGWLQGCWIMTTGQSTVEEQWMAPRAGSMIGVGRTVRNGRLVEYEMVVLRERGDRLAYEAHPSGQPSATFLSQTVTDATVVFANPAHDFPQRIGYQRTNADSVTAWIEGNSRGQSRRIEFAYRRTPCEKEDRP